LSMVAPVRAVVEGGRVEGGAWGTARAGQRVGRRVEAARVGGQRGAPCGRGGRRVQVSLGGQCGRSGRGSFGVEVPLGSFYDVRCAIDSYAGVARDE
jgi:hypothetical protein